MNAKGSQACSRVVTLLLLASCVVLVGWQLYLGLCSNEIFHIAGVYPSLRGSSFWPDITLWNFRPIGYKAVISLLSVVPLNLVGWTSNFTPLFIVLSSLATVGALGLLANGRRFFELKSALNLAVLSALVLGQPGNHPWSADAFSGYFALAGLLMVKNSRWVVLRPALFAFSLGTILFLLKGASVLLALPAFFLLAEKIGWKPAFKKVLLGAVASLLFVALLSPGTFLLLLESTVLQRTHFSPHPIGALHLVTRHVSPVFMLGAGAVWLVCLRRQYVSGWRHLVVPCSMIFSALMFYGIQGKPWSYHFAPAYSFVAFVLIERVDALSSPKQLTRWGLALLLSLVVGFPFSESRPSKDHVGLKDIDGLSSDSEVLYLAYGTRGYATFGYPAACGMMSPHHIQRVKRKKAMSHERLSRSRELLDCALKFSGSRIVYEPKWMALKRKGYKDLLSKLEREYRTMEPNGKKSKKARVRVLQARK